MEAILKPNVFRCRVSTVIAIVVRLLKQKFYEYLSYEKKADFRWPLVDI